MKRLILSVLIGALAVFLLIQLVPYGRQHTNPPVIQDPNWATPEAHQLAQRACYDCHSNETVWPWYSNIAPISWLIAHDVDEGRQVLNFSDWTGSSRSGEGRGEIPEVIQENQMPPPYYVLLHPTARLTSQEKQTLIAGIP